MSGPLNSIEGRLSIKYCELLLLNKKWSLHLLPKVSQMLHRQIQDCQRRCRAIFSGQQPFRPVPTHDLRSSHDISAV